MLPSFPTPTARIVGDSARSDQDSPSCVAAGFCVCAPCRSTRTSTRGGMTIKAAGEGERDQPDSSCECSHRVVSFGRPGAEVRPMTIS